jgi:ketosteroid isomerase-like protein
MRQSTSTSPTSPSAYGDLAIAWGLDRIVADGIETQSRGTRVFQRRDGDWQMIHQHLSIPAPGD